STRLWWRGSNAMLTTSLASRGTLGHEEGEAPALDDFSPLIDDLMLVHDDSGLAQRALHRCLGPTVNGIADGERAQDLPVQSHEGQDDQGRPRHAPSQSRGQTHGQELGDHGRIHRPVARQSAIEGHVHLRQRDGGSALLTPDLDVLEVGAGRRSHDDRRSTTRSVSPSCTTSSRWFTRRRSTVMRPRSGFDDSRLAVTLARSRTVSPILTGALYFQRSPSRARVAQGWVARVKSPAWMASPSKP